MSHLQQDYKVGDKVVMTDYTEVSYSKEWVDSRRGKEATVRSVYTKTFPAAELDKESKPLWRALYGVSDTYTIWGLTVSYEDTKGVYVVSNLGFKKVETVTVTP